MEELSLLDWLIGWQTNHVQGDVCGDVQRNV